MRNYRDKFLSTILSESNSQLDAYVLIPIVTLVNEVTVEDTSVNFISHFKVAPLGTFTHGRQNTRFGSSSESDYHIIYTSVIGIESTVAIVCIRQVVVKQIYRSQIRAVVSHRELIGDGRTRFSHRKQFHRYSTVTTFDGSRNRGATPAGPPASRSRHGHRDRNPQVSEIGTHDDRTRNISRPIIPSCRHKR